MVRVPPPMLTPPARLLPPPLLPPPLPAERIYVTDYKIFGNGVDDGRAKMSSGETVKGCRSVSPLCGTTFRIFILGLAARCYTSLLWWETHKTNRRHTLEAFTLPLLLLQFLELLAEPPPPAAPPPPASCGYRLPEKRSNYPETQLPGTFFFSFSSRLQL